VQPDPYRTSHGGWGQAFADQWALDAIGIDPVAAPPSARVVTVAVIDTGLDFDHPDIDRSRLWRNPNETANGIDDDNDGYADDLIGWNFVAGNNAAWDDSGHGTLIAGIIGAATGNGIGIAGVAPQARLMILKVADFAGHADGAASAAAIRYADQQGADIINLSLGGERPSPAEREAIEHAAGRGILIVVPAGNRASVIKGDGYGGLPGVLTVAAIGPDGQRATFSNFGTLVDVAAPGVDILSLRAAGTDYLESTAPPEYQPGAAAVGDGNYYRASGTSFAAAVATGAAARILAARSELDRASLRVLLMQTAAAVGEPGFAQTTGYGRIDVARAITADPSDFALARIDDVNVTYGAGSAHFTVLGTAQANPFGRATVSIVGANGNPIQLGPELTAPVEDGVLIDTDFVQLLKQMPGHHEWLLELAVVSANGTSRTARTRVSLPEPARAQAAAGPDHD
jgi:subtilisin family serine protease